MARKSSKSRASASDDSSSFLPSDLEMPKKPSLPPGLSIRPAAPGDVPIIVKMIHELADYERAPEQCHATDEKMHAQLFGPAPRAESIVAEMNGQVAAYAIFFHNFSTWEAAPGVYLEDVYVRPAWRRLGIGRLLLTALAAIAKERGCRRFEWAVLDWNKPSRDFYETLGARPQTDWIIYRTEGEALERLAAEGRRLLPTKGAAAKKESAKAAAPSSDAVPPSTLPYVIHTDGGARPNPGTGAWAALVRQGDKVTELTGGEHDSTNNRMEMTAAIRALESLPGKRCEVELHTDSEYLRNGITKWIAGWKRNGWKTASKEPVKNDALWRELDALCDKHNVTWKWLRGHAGNADNERCDQLCTATIDQMERKSSR